MFRRNDLVMVTQAAMMARLLRRIETRPEGELWQVQFTDGRQDEVVVPPPVNDDLDDLDLGNGAWPLI